MNDEEQQISSIKWVWFSILAGFVILLGVTTYFVLPSLVSKTATDVQIVKALQGPFKVKPTTPGG